MKLHYIDEYKEVDIPEIISYIFTFRDCEDIRDMIYDNRWNSILITTIDDAIISQLDLNEIISLDDIFNGEDLASIRKKVADRLRDIFK